jgi:hypothetical protein
MTMYDAAKYYIESYNWVLVPIPPGTKAPTQPGWNIRENCITTVEGCDFFKEHPDYNMGLLLSESGIVALDIDHIKNTKSVFNTLGIDYKKIIDSAPRISGRPNHDKVLFKLPKGVILTRKALAWPTKEDPTKTEVVFELRGGAIQDVLPPSIHPDTKKEYGWIKDPNDGIPELPKELLTIWKEWDKFKKELVDACPWCEKKKISPPSKTRMLGKTSEDVIGTFNANNNVEDLLEKYNYKRTPGGRYLSPYSTSGIAGVIVFKNENKIFSHHGSDPFDTSHSLDAFDLFSHFEHNGDITSAVKTASKILNIGKSVSYDPEMINHGREVFESWSKNKEDKTAEKVPEYLLSIPGVLQDVVEYYNTTAPKTQPQFAVQSALAVGATVLGRRYRTDQNNYSSLYLLNIGKSSTGKEHGKRVIEKILTDAGVDDLIGPSGYTSSGGVLSALIERPCHVSIIDEFGRLMESIGKAGSANKLDAQTTIMEAFGRLDGILRAQGYSSMTLTKTQKDQEGIKQVHSPALTIVAMTTPSTFYSSITSNSIKSGLVPRFLVVESDVGRQLSRQIVETDPSPRLLEWVKKRSVAYNTNGGNLVEDFGAKKPPLPIVVFFESECWPMLRKYDQYVLDMMDEYEKFGLDEMFGKSKEIAQRISLIVAVSCQSDTIKAEHVKWAIKYVKFYNLQTVNRLKNIMSDSDFEAGCKEVLEKIIESGMKGATSRDISRKSSKFRAMDIKQRESMFKVLLEDHGVELKEIPQPRGAPRHAYLYPADGDDVIQ